MRQLTAREVVAAILCVDGGKGGVGKTFLIRLLAYLLTVHNISWVGFDVDPTNQNFIRFHANEDITFIDWTDPSEWDRMFSLMSQADPNSVILIDLASQVGSVLPVQYRRMQATADHLQRPLLRLFCVAAEYDSLNILNQTMNQVSCDRTFAVKNMRAATKRDFREWNESNTRTEFRSQGGSELIMPELSNAAARELERQDLPFAAASLDNLAPYHHYDVFAYLAEIRTAFAPLLERIAK
ncbi:hypothetical protein [Qipengyuania sp. NPDC077563]|uniref:nucleotide-binding protein n=1 Tax=Qipengyuania sp. NPDC077563 TaxID=3364497 RepID=UPI00384FE761